MIYPRNGFPMGKMMIHQWFFWLIFRQTLTNPLYIYIWIEQTGKPENPISIFIEQTCQPDCEKRCVLSMSLFLPETLELAKTSPVSTAWLHLPLPPRSWTVQSLHLVVTLGASEILGGFFQLKFDVSKI